MLAKDEKMVNQFLHHMKNSMKQSDNTIKAYNTALHQFFSEYQDFSKIERSQVNQYKNKLSEKLAPSTVHLKVAAIGSFYNYLVDELEILKMTPVYKIKLPSIQEKMIIIPEKSDIDSEIKSLKKEGNDMLAIALLIGSRVGLRIGEVINLNIEDINYSEGVFYLHKTKTTNFRPVAVDKATLNEIKEYCNRNKITQGRLLRNKSMQPMTNSWMHKLVKEKCSHHFHLNRHFCISGIANKFGIYQASIQAGHSSTQVTEKVYSHINMKSQKAMMDDMWG